jgi:hypothetical protein
LDWTYISGFFDGEGGITIDAPKGSRVLVLTAVIAKKSKEVLEIIAGFLRSHGISSRFAVSGAGINSLRIGRIKDIISFLSHLTLTVKARQVEESLDYLRGHITGNDLLSIFNQEYLAGRRRFKPFVHREWNFRLTHEEATRLASRERAEASVVARNCLRRSDLPTMVMKLPRVFGVQDVALAFDVPKRRARYMINLMRRDGLVLAELRHNSHTRTLICKRIT